VQHSKIDLLMAGSGRVSRGIAGPNGDAQLYER